MLRISEVRPPNRGVTLRLEGRLTGPWVDETRHACERVLAAGQTLGLDLADLEYLDANAVALLVGLGTRGVSILACSPFVEARLKASLPDAR